MSQGAMNWPFLTLTGLARCGPRPAPGPSAGRGRRGSAAGRHTSAAGSTCAALVDVRRHRQPGRALDRFQRLEPLVQPRPAKRLARSAVGLVERRLEDQRDLQPLGQLGERVRNGKRQLLDFRSRTGRRSKANPAPDHTDADQRETTRDIATSVANRSASVPALLLKLAQAGTLVPDGGILAASQNTPTAELGKGWLTAPRGATFSTPLRSHQSSPPE